MMMKNECDVAVVGGGHNGLICAAYLARAGLNVILLEARHETGGGLDTLSFAGFRYNPHAIYHMMAEYMPPYKDLALYEGGVRYIFPEVQSAYISKNHPPLIFYQDPQKTAQYISATFSTQDGRAYDKMYQDFKEYSEKILMPLTYVLPIPAIEQTVVLNNAKDHVGRRYNEIAELSPLEILNLYQFSEPVKAGVLNLFTMWGLSPYEIGFIFPLYVYRMTNAALVAGGSHRLSSAIYRKFVAAGGRVLDRAEVIKVTMTNGKADGVITRDGSIIKAKAVVSSVDPQQNYLQFFTEKEIPKDLVDSAKNWKWEKETFFNVHLALRAAPKYIGTESTGDANKALITFMGVDHTDKLLDHFDELEQGRLAATPLGHATCPSLFDPIQAFDGFQTGRWECLVPFDADWDKVAGEYGQRCVAEWKKYAPNIDPIHTLVYPPTYIEKKFKNMVRGSFKHGAYIPLQMGYLRPNDRCSQAYTPIDGFYNCGASVYPGGMILGAGGYLAANVLAEDFQIKKTWDEPVFITAARAAGIIAA